MRDGARWENIRDLLEDIPLELCAIRAGVGMLRFMLCSSLASANLHFARLKPLYDLCTPVEVSYRMCVLYTRPLRCELGQARASQITMPRYRTYMKFW